MGAGCQGNCRDAAGDTGCRHFPRECGGRQGAASACVQDHSTCVRVGVAHVSTCAPGHVRMPQHKLRGAQLSLPPVMGGRLEGLSFLVVGTQGGREAVLRGEGRRAGPSLLQETSDSCGASVPGRLRV